ncbi:35694_t:CDS:2, partial [Racocetra persica]
QYSISPSMSSQRNIPLQLTVLYQQGCSSFLIETNMKAIVIIILKLYFVKTIIALKLYLTKILIEIALLTTMVQSLINKVRILKADKSTTPKDHLVHVVDDDNQTTYKNEPNKAPENINSTNVSENNETTKIPPHNTDMTETTTNKTRISKRSKIFVREIEKSP